MPFWSDLFRVWKLQGSLDPIMRRELSKEIEGASVSVPDAISDIRGSGEYMGGSRGVIKLRDSNDFVDLSSVTNRQSRYKEYERLRVVAEIENAVTIFADEACMAGSTQIATPFGMLTLEELARTKRPNEKFLVYCYDFSKQDYTLGWAHSPRKTKRAKTVVVTVNDGNQFECTADHRVLLKTGKWIEAGNIKEGEELMPFYRLRPKPHALTNKRKYFPRIFTHKLGWMRERDFIDEWRNGKLNKREQKLYKIAQCISKGCNAQQVRELNRNEITKKPLTWPAINERLLTEGFTFKELSELGQKPDYRRVISIWEGEEKDVYDLSVDNHENFCTDIGVFHNCQIGENGHMFDIKVKNPDIKQELEFLFFHPSMLNIDDNLWGWCRDLFLFGDHFMELVIDPDEPKLGVIKIQILPPESVYRIETIKGKVIEFQQSKEGPDYQSLSRVEVTKATEADLAQATAIRFAPESMIHFRIGGARKTFHPYGVSLIEAARGPAHQLRLMEDAMLIYRLSRAPERRVFYIDVGQLPMFKAEALMTRMQDMFRKKKTFSTKGGSSGAGPVEERWVPPAQDEDFWIPIRPNANTRVETLPGACLALDVKIPLLDGRTLTLADIITEYQAGKKLWAYSCSPTGSIAPGVITWAGVTRKNAQVLKLTFDNGESVVCTPDHKFPIIGKGKVQAKDLKAGESMIPFNTKKEVIKPFHKYDYLQVYDVETRKWVFVHRLAAEHLKDTSYEQVMIFDESLKDAKKNVVHHKDFNRFNNDPTNLAWMSWKDHNLYHRSNKHNGDKISEERSQRDIKLKKMSEIGLKTLNRKLKDKKFQSKSGRPVKPWSKSIMDEFVRLIKDCSIEEALQSINNNQLLRNDFHSSHHGFDRNAMNKMLKYFGYRGLTHLKKEINLYNHKLIKVEWLSEKIDTGTITIDGPEEFHDYHTFAISPCGIYTCNSNLGEIDDALYFRNKLFISLCFPKNYMANEDPQITKMTLSSVDVKFARLIERLQRSVATGLTEIAIRHLQLRGFPPVLYDDLQIKMTPPSHYREISENEVKDARVNRLATLKGTMVLSDLDLLMDVMHYQEDEAKEKVARSMIQKLQELKLQVMSQNPQLLGIAMPEAAPNEMGAAPGGPTPQQMPGQENSELPPGGKEMDAGGEGQEAGSAAMDTYGQPEAPPQGTPIPDASEDDIRQYDLEIFDLSQGMDEEEDIFDYGE